MKAKKIALLGVLTAVALTIFIVEAQIPLPVPIPGVKLGLANIVTVFTVFAIGSKEGCAVLACRILLGSVFGGNVSALIYSAAGGALAILVTVLLKKMLTARQLWVAGALGAVAHSIGQMIAAVCVSRTVELLVYLPVMIAIGICTGIFTGLCAQVLRNRGDKLWQTIYR